MCLTKLKSQPLGPKTAKEDITVFKVLIVWGGEYISPYRSFGYIIGKTYTSYLDKPEGYQYMVSKGIHSFRSKGAANKLIKSLNHARATFVIAECIIPEGSKYHLGYNLEIVSDKFIIVKKL